MEGACEGAFRCTWASFRGGGTERGREGRGGGWKRENENERGEREEREEVEGIVARSWGWGGVELKRWSES
eukprot:6199120-Pleurochrysis_carterae.AAC.1